MRYSCPNCSAPVLAATTGPTGGLPGCAYCGSMGAMDVVAVAVDASTGRARDSHVAAPASIEVEHDAHAVVLTRRGGMSWPGSGIFGGLIGLALAGFAVVIIVMVVAMFQWSRGFGAMRVVPVVMGVVMLLVVGAMAWGLAMTMFGKTVVHVTRSAVSVAHTLRPARARVVAAADLQQLYCDRRTGRGGQEYFRVRALTRSQRGGAGDITLVDHLPEQNAALFIEQEIETFLDIVDVPVQGEL